MKFGKRDAPEYVRRDERGTLTELITSGPWESLLCGEMRAGAELGHHRHRHTIVYFHLQSGRVRISTRDSRTGRMANDQLVAGQAYVFRPEEVRVIHFEEAGHFILAKSHRYDPENPDLIEESL